ncbi:unnamed protein product [Urochloa humidicola]
MPAQTNLMGSCTTATEGQVSTQEPDTPVITLTEQPNHAPRVVDNGMTNEQVETSNTHHPFFADTPINNVAREDNHVVSSAQEETAVVLETISENSQLIATETNGHAEEQIPMSSPNLNRSPHQNDPNEHSNAAETEPAREQNADPAGTSEHIVLHQFSSQHTYMNPLDLQHADDLTSFLNFVSGPPNTPILHTPPRANPQPTDIRPPPTNEPTTQQRKSSRLADKAKANPGKGSIQLAQQVLINKLGDLVPDAQQKKDDNFDSLVQRLPRPFTKHTMEALQVLVEQGNKPKGRKKSKVAPSPVMEQPTMVA